MLGARLKQLGVPTVIVETNAKAGDSWRNRYRSLVLHDPVWYDHLPYIPFPAPLARLHPQGQDGRLAGDVRQGDGAELLGRHGVRLEQASPSVEGRWTVVLLRDGRPITLHPAQLVFATGAYGPPKLLDLAGAAEFKGEIFH